MNIHNVVIRNKDGHDDELSTADNIEILINGQAVQGITNLILEIVPGQIAVLKLEMFATLEVSLSQAKVEVEKEDRPPTQYDVVDGTGQVVGKVQVP